MNKYCLFVVSLCAAAVLPAYADMENISGKWVYDHGHNGIGGEMEITDCADNKCEIDFATYNGAHTCELDGGTLTLDRNSAMVAIDDCKITITAKSENIIDVSDNGNCRFLCGMSGMFTGRWQNARVPFMYSAGFDCNRAVTDVEQTICHNKNLAQYDSEVNILYKASSGQKASQKKWLTARNQCETDVKCLTEQYDARLRELVSSITKDKFNMFDYARLVSDDGWFHPERAILISNFIRDRIGDDEYEQFISCSNRTSRNIFNRDEIFAAYGCPGLFTIMESAIYIDKNQIWLSYLDDDKTRTFAPRDTPGQIPTLLSEWLQDLKTRAQDNIKSEKIINKL